MRNSWLLLVSAACLLLSVPSLKAQNAEQPEKAQKAERGPKLEFISGPTNVMLGKLARLQVPTGFVFLNAKNTREYIKAGGNPVSGAEMGMLASTNEPWKVFFDFSEVGYVKDDDKKALDHPEKILDSIKQGTIEANNYRKERGNPPINVVGWEVPPKYDEKSHNLEWAVRATVEDRDILNYNTRILGRKGVMEVILVVDPEQLKETLPEFRAILSGYAFDTGNSYAEYRPGDKVAAYGLAALVAGGAAVGAAKLGLLGPVLLIFKKFWVFLIAGFAALLSTIKNFFKRIFGRKDDTIPRE